MRSLSLAGCSTVCSRAHMSSRSFHNPEMCKDRSMIYRKERHALQPAKALADIFQERPERWGMRGDPHLWREMHVALGSSSYPSTEDQLTTLLEQTYQELTGAPLSHHDPVFVERYNHGG